jgi:acyl carrier protein
MSIQHDEHAAYEAVVDAVELVCGLPRTELGPDVPIDSLGIDSLTAAELVQEVESALGTQVDQRAIASQWSSYTVASLAKLFVSPREATDGS